MTFQLTSPSFDDGQPIPPRYTCDGEDVSPALAWADAPAGTRGFALLCDDPDAPGGTWHHWALYDIPAGTSRLEQAFPMRPESGPVKQGVNDFSNLGYGGPCPPPGHGPHHYRFRLLAINVDTLSLPARPTCVQVETAAKSHALAEALLVGTFAR